jgi:hypothetical protein
MNQHRSLNLEKRIIFFDAWNVSSVGSAVKRAAQMFPINLVIKGEKGGQLGWRVRYGQTF